jgi:hypothetical protein
MAKSLASLIPDRHEDERYARALIGGDAAPTGRLRIVKETNQLQLEWVGTYGKVWLPILLVSEHDRREAILAPEHMEPGHG